MPKAFNTSLDIPTIRYPRGEHWEGVTAIALSLRKPSRDSDGWIAWWNEQPQQRHVFIALLGRETVVGFEAHEVTDYGVWLVELAVHENFRRGGVGSELYRNACNHVAIGRGEVQCIVPTDNIEARAFLRHCKMAESRPLSKATDSPVCFSRDILAGPRDDYPPRLQKMISDDWKRHCK